MNTFGKRWASLNGSQREGQPSIADFERKAMLAAERHGFLADSFEHAEYSATKAKELKLDTQPFYALMAALRQPVAAASDAADNAEAEFKQHPDYARLAQ